MSVAAALVAEGVPFGEGPVWCPDGTLVCTSVSHGALFRVRPERGVVEPLADTGGGANAAALASDGSFVVAQNGGLDLAAAGHDVGAPPVRWVTPGLQRAWPNGRVVYLTAEPMQMTNDLVVAPDGTVYFTDPGPYPGSVDRIARVVSFAPDGTTAVIAGGFWYVNGIAFDPDGTTLVVVEAEGLMRLPDFGRGEREPVVERFGETGADGFCLDADGRYYVAAKRANGVRVVERDGTELDFLGLDALGADGFVTNCCFGGADGRTLFATEARGGRVVAWEGMPVPGLPLHPWPAPVYANRNE